MVNSPGKVNLRPLSCSLKPLKVLKKTSKGFLDLKSLTIKYYLEPAP